MSIPLLEVTDLSVSFGSENVREPVLNRVSFSISRGETVVLVGESGSGKSLSAMSIVRLLPHAARIDSGSILLNGLDLFKLSERQMRNIRGASVGMVFQEPQSSLNPVMTVGAQIAESVRRHQGIRGKKLTERVCELMDAVGINEPHEKSRQYPHEFSGGMKQRVMIAIALAANPELLIADEPTTALDVTIQAQVLELLKAIQAKQNMGMLFITHDLAVARQIADRIVVLKEGQVVETGTNEVFYKAPSHPYSKALFDAIPSWDKRLQEGLAPSLDARATLLTVEKLRVWFPVRSGFFEKKMPPNKAVDGVDLEVYEGETLALVGESGSGKTTLSKAVLQLLRPTAGSVHYADKDLCQIDSRQLRSIRADLQIVFQDPYSSMNPRMLISDIIKEGMNAQNVGDSIKDRDDRAAHLMEQVGLEVGHLKRYPHEFSGGQRQRICIARALAVEPKVLICDEPTSALDVSVQAQILRLLRELQDNLGLTYLFVTHNIGVVAYMAHRVAVMYRGQIVENGYVQQVLQSPEHEYTRALLQAVPRLDNNS
jgi:ABC-type microcin C transport system duplicated ATPase subunit YejF